MSWPSIVALAHRAANASETITVSHLGVTTTYPNSHFVEKIDRRLLDSGARVQFRYLRAYLPKGSGLAAPQENDTLTRAGSTYTVSSVQDPAGRWIVEAVP